MVLFGNLVRKLNMNLTVIIKRVSDEYMALPYMLHISIKHSFQDGKYSGKHYLSVVTLFDMNC